MIWNNRSARRTAADSCCQNGVSRPVRQDLSAAPAATTERTKLMKFTSTRLIAADIKSMVGFYEMVTGQTAEWLAPVFAEIVTPAATLAIGSAEPGANRTAIIEFQVDDVDAEFERLKGAAMVVQEPKLMPWGNRAAQFRDPEGTLVSIYTPVTGAAQRRFGA